MTSSKCEHFEAGHNTLILCDDGIAECEHCDVRFVPSDVLEEAREALVRLDQMGRSDGAADKSVLRRWIREAVAPALARIDAVLGK